jgi:transglutaminase-like putative cysteine protease
MQKSGKYSKKITKMILAAIVITTFSTSCGIKEPENITLPTPITSGTTAVLPDINLNPPPISVVVPPVTTVGTTAATTPFSHEAVTENPLASFSDVPLAQYMGYDTATGIDGGIEDATGGVQGGQAAQNGQEGQEGQDNSVTDLYQTQTAQITTSATDQTTDNYLEKYPDREIFRPYEYKFLSSPQKQLYELLENTFMSVSNDLTIPDNLDVTVSDFDSVFTLFLNKDPHTYYVKPTADTKYSKSTGKLYAVTFTYLYPKVTVTSRNEQTDVAMRKILDLAETAPTDYDKVLYFYNYLVKNVTYDTSTDDCGNIYGALVDGRADCMGYSYAMKMLANAVGIDAITVSGTNGADEKHMWNMVKLDGNWYQLDATYGDTDSDYINYDYCLTTDARIYSSYTQAALPDGVVYPKANALDDNYYVKNNLFATTESDAIKILKTAIADAADNGDSAVQILCATQTVYDNTEKTLTSPASIASIDSTDNIVSLIDAVNAEYNDSIDIANSSYIMNDKTDVIKILLSYT